jgi:hypothetical protein
MQQNAYAAAEDDSDTTKKLYFVWVSLSMLSSFRIYLGEPMVRSVTHIVVVIVVVRVIDYVSTKI